MKKIGETLRQERIKRGLSVGDVNLKIKLSREIIEAMEEGRMEDLPQPVYVRGFVRSYAAMLGLDPHKLGADLSEICPDPGSSYVPSECAPQSSGSMVSIAGEKKQNNLVAILVLFLVLAAIGVMAWYAVSSNVEYAQEQSQAEEAPATVEEAIRTEEVQEPPVLVEDAAVQETDEPQEPGDAAEVTEVEEAEVAADAPEVTDEASLEPFEEGGPHRLVVMADEECWLGVSVDGETGREMTLFPGNIQVFTFTEGMEIKLGNPGGVRLQYDGASLPFEFTGDRPKTLTLPLPR